MLVHEKNRSNPNTIDEQLQIIHYLFLPKVNNLTNSILNFPLLPRGLVGSFSKNKDAIPQLFGILILIFDKNYLHTPMFLTTSV
jgi:hypothetical protein